MYFVASLSGRGLAPATIAIAGQMSAIGFLHKLNGVPDPVGSGVVQKMLQGVRRMGVAGDLRLPVTADILVWLCVKLDGGLFGPYQASMMRALVTVAFFVFFRLGELVQKGGSVVVMLDGVVFTGEGMSVTLLRSKASVVPVVIRVVRALDVRVEGPSQVLDFLGITIDVPMGLSRLPRDKVDRCRGLVEDFLVCQKVTLGQLQQLLGLLNFACRAVVPGRPFLATLYSLTKGIRRQCYKVRLTRAAKEDLAIWSTFLTDFNCCSFFLEGTVHSRVDVGLYTDASTTVGFGVCCGSEWVCGRWSGVWLGKGILVLETYAVLLAMAVWGPQLANRSILMHVDNLALVQILNKRYSAAAEVVPLIRVLFLLGLRYNIVLAAQHVPGVLNVAADALSRFDFQAFRTSSPRAAFLPRRVPAWIRPEVFDPWTQPIASFPW